MEQITNFVDWLNGVVWGVPMLVLILGVGVYLTMGLRLYSIIKIPLGFAMLWSGRIPGKEKGEISPFNALMTSLSATIGTGEYRGGGDCYLLGWTWCYLLDVDDGFGRHGNQVCRGCLRR